MAVTLREKAYNQIRNLILTGALKQGEFISERILVENLGMSRTPIRSAIERLEVEGLVKHSPNRGLIVAEISINKAVDIYDVRKALEAHVVRRLSEYTLTQEEIDWFSANLSLQQKYVEENEVEKFSEKDYEFHNKLIEVYGNSEIIQIMSKLQDKLYLIAVNVLRKDPKRIIVSYDDHFAIFDYIQKGQGDDAAQRIIDHLEFGKRILIS